MVYTIMNKDTPLVDFVWKYDKFGEPYPFMVKGYSMPWFMWDITKWIQSRGIVKHRRNMKKLLKTLGEHGENLENLLKFTHGLALTDCLWVNHDDKYRWENINLFDNEFDDAIAEISLLGSNVLGEISETSPEYTTCGVHAKCWHRESDGNIYLYKLGSEEKNMEAYSEMYASQLLRALGYSHVDYDIIEYHGRLVSRCKLMTDKEHMLLPISVYPINSSEGYLSLSKECMWHGQQEQLAEVLLTDALILNEDRHLGNIGIICDADSFSVQGIAPIYDNGQSLCFDFREGLSNFDSDAEDIFSYAEDRKPALYSDFIRYAKIESSEEQLDHLKYLKGFKFREQGEYNLSSRRLSNLSEIVQIQLNKLLR